MKICVLGSSSGGNATFMELDDVKILIDAGLSARIIKQRLEALSVDPSRLDAIFVTHEHTDHINGLKQFLKKHPVPVYCTRATAEAVESILNICPEFYLFSPGELFKFASIKIEAFPVFHDAQDPVGFCFYTAKGKLGLVSDIGYVTSLVKQKLADSNVLIIESNHDPKMLLADPKRPWSVKQRIKGRQGHLSNEGACELIESVSHHNLHHVVLFHLSKDCNRPEIALKKMRDCLCEKGFDHTQVHLAYPDKTSAVIEHTATEPQHERDRNFLISEQLEIPMVS